jgi:ABC-type branched-subunit amino acid transport system substrate-binding protein
MRRAQRRALAGLLGLALIGAACGGDDSSGGSGTAQVDEGVKNEVQNQLNATTTTAAGTATTAPAKAPATMDEWLALWDTERAAVVKKIKDGGFGLSADGKTVTGPGDFKMDLSKCAPGWSNTEGLTDTEIRIGLTMAQSGTLADYGNIGRGMDVLWGYQNDKGGFKDSAGKTRKLTMITKDDGYDAARTIPLVDELIDSEKVFIVWTLGSPNTLKTYDKLNQRCIPQPFSMTGHPAWGDPVNHPWTTGMALSYTSEAVLWGAFIEKHLDELLGPNGKVTVGALVMNNDFGKAYDVGFRGYLANSPIKDKIDYQPELVEPSAPTITDAMTTVASKNPQVFIAMTAGTSCTQAVTEVAQNGMKEKAKYLFTGQPCKGSSFMGKDKVGGDGSASDGWWIAGGGNIDGNAPAQDNNPFVKWARDLLAAKGYNYKSSANLLGGFLYGWPFWQALQIAGELPGGLTRTNLIVAMRSMEMTNPNLLKGIRFNMNGNKDAYPIEGSEIARYDFAQQTWIQQGDIVELSGKSANCAWDQAAGSCK